MRTVVYKIGGSLLTLPDLVRRMRRLFEQRAGCRALLVAGGGEAADIVRRWDEIHKLGEERAHLLALKSLALNEWLLNNLLPETRIVSTRTEAETAWQSGCMPILCCNRFLAEEEQGCDMPLPHTWAVTSDSIAAWITLRWPADELVLVKSTGFPSGERCDENNLSPRVDSYFRELSPRLPAASWVNLRSDALDLLRVKCDVRSGMRDRSGRLATTMKKER